MSTTYQVTGAASNAGGSTGFTGQITVEDPVVLPPSNVSVTIVPASAPPGTLRTITITATGATSYTCSAPGLSVQPTAQPNVFTTVA